METLTAPRTYIPTYVIDGSKARTWPEIVASINAFIPDSKWQGNSLDALDDILYGGYGTPEKFIVIWKASDISRQMLGLEAAHFHKNLFETIVEIFGGHENIELRLD